MAALVRRITSLSAVVIVTTGMAYAQAAPPLEERVRELYALAEYDQALSLIGDSQVPTAQQYRALCLLALGRQADAKAALEQLISASPEFTVSEEDVPPRFVALFIEQRKEIVPGVLRKMFAEAREDYRAKAFDRALPQFKRVLALSSAAEVREVEGVDDLRLLAESFIDIASASETAKPEVAAAPTAAAAAPPAATRVRHMTPAVAVKQDMPPWPSTTPIFRPLTGSVRLRIGADGRVTNATMVKNVDPRYDARVLAAASFWEYTPATENGVPIESESIVEINIKPPR
jgi:tetratricopeptide (TPR) repeat protein